MNFQPSQARRSVSTSQPSAERSETQAKHSVHGSLSLLTFRVHLLNEILRANFGQTENCCHCFWSARKKENSIKIPVGDRNQFSMVSGLFKFRSELSSHFSILLFLIPSRLRRVFFLAALSGAVSPHRCRIQLIIHANYIRKLAQLGMKYCEMWFHRTWLISSISLNWLWWLMVWNIIQIDLAQFISHQFGATCWRCMARETSWLEFQCFNVALAYRK